MAMMRESEQSGLRHQEILWRVAALGSGIVALILAATLWSPGLDLQAQKPMAASILESPEDFRELRSYLQQVEIETLDDLRQALDAWVLAEAANFGSFTFSCKFEVTDHNETQN